MIFVLKLRVKMESKKTHYQQEIILLIKRLRQDNDVSQSQLSEILGLSSGQIGNIESPKFTHKYTIRQIYEICKHFKYPIEQLFLNDEEMTLPKKEIIDTLIKKIIDYDK